MHLQNVVMQLRKVYSHPFLFDPPLDSRTCLPVVDERLVDANGKTMALERLLRLLDALTLHLGTWTSSTHGSSTSPLERRAEMDHFRHGRDKPGVPRLFLLSTPRAGGLGIILTAADTVVFYDQD
ncbi:hypothetical protein BJV74DRAFT_885493 [Russula compacta]|nr:hypothetical protein BJV74DRAFT_885493 [Russula compacta]